MSNETVVIMVLIIVFLFSVWLGSGIWLVKKKVERIEQILTFWERKRRNGNNTKL